MGVLRIQQTDRMDVPAIRAKLHLDIAGSALVMGNAATERVREVREVALGLQAAGVPAAQIEVRGVEISNRAGLLAKQQKARFLVVVEAEPALLPQVLGLLADQKQVNLQRVEWVFDDFEAGLRLAPRAMLKARQRADAIAEAAGHRVVGVLSASDSWDMPVGAVRVHADWMGQEVPRAERSRLAPLDAGVDYSSTRVLTVQLTVDFQLD